MEKIKKLVIKWIIGVACLLILFQVFSSYLADFQKESPKINKVYNDTIDKRVVQNDSIWHNTEFINLD